MSPPHVLWQSFRAKIQWYNCLPDTWVTHGPFHGVIQQKKKSQLFLESRKVIFPISGGFAFFGKGKSWGGWEELGSIEFPDCKNSQSCPCGFHRRPGNATKICSESQSHEFSATYVIIITMRFSNINMILCVDIHIMFFKCINNTNESRCKRFKIWDVFK